MNVRVIGVLLFLAAGLFSSFKILYDDGIVGQTKKPLRAPVLAAKGCFCHGDSASPRTRVWIAGPETLAAGTRALYTINVAKDSSIAAGFDVAAFFGDLGVYDSTATQLMRIDPNNPIDSLELTHTAPRLAEGRDTVSWSFWYRAPQTFDIIDTIYANGNSVDTSFDPSGDYWNFAPDFLVHVTGPAGLREQPAVQAFQLSQNYPNPFNPSTTISFSLPRSAFTTLTIFNTMGQRVAALLSWDLGPGTHSTVWNAGTMASGVYYCRLQAGNLTETKKLLLMK